MGNRGESLRSVNSWAGALGWNPRKTVAGSKDLRGYWRDVTRFRELGGVIDFYRPQLGEQHQGAGSADGHYFWQDLLVARRVAQTDPARHLDVGSRVDGFVAHLLAFRDVQVVDIRDLDSAIEGLTFVRADGRTLSGIEDGSVESLSSLHALEHFGLGRYGDELDPKGHLEGMRALQRVLARGGRLWISFPIGLPRVEFNSQRVIDPVEPVELLQDLHLVSFTAIPSAGEPLYGASPSDYRNDENWCGLYEFTRA